MDKIRNVRFIGGDALDALKNMEAESVDCVVTSPPYWGLRDYGVEGQLGMETTLGEHIDRMVLIFEEVKRVLKKTGTLWVNYGDCYGTPPNGRPADKVENDDRTFRDKPFSTIGPVREDDPNAGFIKSKDLAMVPARFAIAMQNAGWWVRSEIVWAKPNPMPESIKDRPATAHEKIFMFTKSNRYFYDAEAVKQESKHDPEKYKSPDGWNTNPGAHGSFHPKGREKGKRKPDKQRGHGRRHAGFNDRWDKMSKSEQQEAGRNLRNVWDIAIQGFPDAHFATFPTKIPEICIMAGCPTEVCAKCGRPKIRVGVKSLLRTKKAAKKCVVDDRDKGADRSDQGSNRQKAGHIPGMATAFETKGFEPTCSCDAGFVPGVVLDPFGGSGTTGLVADRLQRQAILIELNPEYMEIAKNRIRGDAVLLSWEPEE